MPRLKSSADAEAEEEVARGNVFAPAATGYLPG